MAKKKRRNTPGGFGGPRGGGIGGGNLMAQVRKMQEEMEKAQEELGDVLVTGSAGGGMVEIDMDGHQTIQAIRLKPDVVDPEDVEMLQDLLLAAINDAAEKSKATAEDRMGGLTAGLDLPPGLGL